MQQVFKKHLHGSCHYVERWCKVDRRAVENICKYDSILNKGHGHLQGDSMATEGRLPRNDPSLHTHSTPYTHAYTQIVWTYVHKGYAKITQRLHRTYWEVVLQATYSVRSMEMTRKPARLTIQEALTLKAALNIYHRAAGSENSSPCPHAWSGQPQTTTTKSDPALKRELGHTTT